MEGFNVFPKTLFMPACENHVWDSAENLTNETLFHFIFWQLRQHSQSDTLRLVHKSFSPSLEVVNIGKVIIERASLKEETRLTPPKLTVCSLILTWHSASDQMFHQLLIMSCHGALEQRYFDKTGTEDDFSGLKYHKIDTCLFSHLLSLTCSS